VFLIQLIQIKKKTLIRHLNCQNNLLIFVTAIFFGKRKYALIQLAFYFLLMPPHLTNPFQVQFGRFYQSFAIYLQLFDQNSIIF
jgi:hypothetical protein